MDDIAKGTLMALVWNWRAVLTRAWSVRLIVLAAILSGAEVALPMLDGILPIPPGTFAAVAGFVSAGALLARITAQKDVPE